MSLVATLRDRFAQHQGKWIPGGSIERWVIKHTDYTASNARRRLREMVEDGILDQEERRHQGKNHAWYRLRAGVEPETQWKYDYVFDPERQTMVEKRVPVAG